MCELPVLLASRPEGLVSVLSVSAVLGFTVWKVNDDFVLMPEPRRRKFLAEGRLPFWAAALGFSGRLVGIIFEGTIVLFLLYRGLVAFSVALDLEVRVDVVVLVDFVVLFDPALVVL